MNTVEKLSGLLEEKKSLFLQYEEATVGLLESDADSAEHYIMQRDKLQNDIDETDEEIARVCDGQPDAVLLLNTINARIDFGAVPNEYHTLFYDGQAVRSVVGRIIERDRQVVVHLEEMREEAREKIKENKEVPKIKKYLTDLSEEPLAGGLRNKKI